MSSMGLKEITAATLTLGALAIASPNYTIADSTNQIRRENAASKVASGLLGDVLDSWSQKRALRNEKELADYESGLKEKEKIILEAESRLRNYAEALDRGILGINLYSHQGNKRSTRNPLIGTPARIDLGKNLLDLCYGTLDRETEIIYHLVDNQGKVVTSSIDRPRECIGTLPDVFIGDAIDTLHGLSRTNPGLYTIFATQGDRSDSVPIIVENSRFNSD